MISLFNILPAMIHNWPDAMSSCIANAEVMEKEITETQKRIKQKVRTRRVHVTCLGTTMTITFFVVSTPLNALISRVVCDHVYLEIPNLSVFRWALNDQSLIFLRVIHSQYKKVCIRSFAM